MSFYFKNIQPNNVSSTDDEDDVDLDNIILSGKHKSKRDLHYESDNSDEETDGASEMAFVTLKKAHDEYVAEERSKSSIMKQKNNIRGDKYKQAEIQTEERGTKTKNSENRAIEPKKGKENLYAFSKDIDSISSDDSEGGFFEGEEDLEYAQSSNKNQQKERKHAPTVQSSKKPVSLIRTIPGLNTNRNANANTNLYQDIRFDKSLGKSEDYAKIRGRYKFLDEYRQKEIEQLANLLHDRKFINKISDGEKVALEQKLTSMKSKLQSLQSRDLEKKIIDDYEDQMNKGNMNKYHLKKSEKKKIVNKWKFDHMKAKQREKVMERKRKKQLGKEFKQFEFHKR
ncbi:related to rRNA biogenesis protein RRP36 [Saccharomycodes ludwigii]|uniref:rRNA biogenesis protein RRP36 n=1 Tax=Saccharomycodes ludwigii TaxID=36035 RepID=A0A376B577_9ASCO|nr:related to rRNA biogenesis protein RRP36 [Saccharomycodes ludwigii]